MAAGVPSLAAVEPLATTPLRRRACAEVSKVATIIDPTTAEVVAG